MQKRRAGAPLQLVIERAGQPLGLAIIPTLILQGDSRAIGIRPKLDDSRPGYDTVRRLGPVQAVPAAIHETGALLHDAVTMIGRMVRGRLARFGVRPGHDCTDRQCLGAKWARRGSCASSP